MVSLSVKIYKNGHVSIAGNDGTDPKIPIKFGDWETTEDEGYLFRKVGDKAEVINSALDFLKRHVTDINIEEDWFDAVKTFFNKEEDDKYRVWPEWESLTWSTINDLLGDDDIGDRLQKLTLDLTDCLLEEEENLKELVERLKKTQSKIDFIKSNLGVCVDFGVRKLNYDTHVKYIHDKIAKTVEVESKDGIIEVKQQNLTIIPLNLKDSYSR